MGEHAHTTQNIGAGCWVAQKISRKLLICPSADLNLGFIMSGCQLKALAIFLILRRWRKREAAAKRLKNLGGIGLKHKFVYYCQDSLYYTYKELCPSRHERLTKALNAHDMTWSTLIWVSFGIAQIYSAVGHPMNEFKSQQYCRVLWLIIEDIGLAQ